MKLETSYYNNSRLGSNSSFFLTKQFRNKMKNPEGPYSRPSGLKNHPYIDIPLQQNAKYAEAVKAFRGMIIVFRTHKYSMSD